MTAVCFEPLPIAPSTTVGQSRPEHQENPTRYICGKALPCPHHESTTEKANRLRAVLDGAK